MPRSSVNEAANELTMRDLLTSATGERQHPRPALGGSTLSPLPSPVPELSSTSDMPTATSDNGSDSERADKSGEDVALDTC